MKALEEAGFGGWAIAEVAGGDAERLKFLAGGVRRAIGVASHWGRVASHWGRTYPLNIQQNAFSANV